MPDTRPKLAPVLAAKDLTKRFGGLAAVHDVTLALHKGELHAVIGPNGAGKSTLVNLLSGELRPTAGSLSLEGEDVTGRQAWQLARRGIARSFQRTNIFGALTVMENVRLAVQARTVSGRDLLRLASHADDLHAEANRLLSRLGLDQARERIAATLSHGEQRQLEIAMTLATRPSVILLDEPLAGMGAEESVTMGQLIRGLAEDHAVLLIEHDMDAVFSIADWITVMVDGGILAEGRGADVRTNPSVQDAYLGHRA